MMTVSLVNLLIVAVGAILLLVQAEGQSRVKLNGDWKVQNSNGSIAIPAVVPGSIYTDLMRKLIIQDPYYGSNDEAYRWVAMETWTYSHFFNVSSDFLKKNVVNLLCGGIDTVAEIAINGQPAGKTNNMFTRYIFDVKKLLKVGANDIQITFQSPVKSAASASANYAYDVPPDCNPPAQHGECHVNFLRKEQCSFSWDWGPSFPTVGIWRNITLESFNTAAIRYVTTETIPADSAGEWYLNVTVFLEVGSDTGRYNLSAQLLGTGVPVSSITQRQALLKNGVETTDATVTLLLHVEKKHGVKTWWPNGFGSQPLYDVQVTFSTSQGDKDTKIIRTGFRTIELIQEPIPEAKGLSFYFKVNGFPIFMRGSNWIPADSFQERVTEDRLRNLLSSAKNANMNMLRVWGGGIYEQEKFYEIADEFGIMIWQDMMFACALYPVNKDYLKSVSAEIQHQIRRLKRHPSIAIWSGNNENEGAIAENWYGIKNFTLYEGDYRTLYIYTILPIILQEDGRRPFTSSSPSNGLETMKENWIAKNPGDSLYGDVHYYNYGVKGWDWRTFPTPRFASEYGYESWCNLETLYDVSSAADRVSGSNFTEHRQHHTNGNKQMLDMAAYNLNLPNNSNPQKQFEYIIYITQISQAMAIKTETEHYRRHQSQVVNNEGMTMGALYWQLNDIWQAPTWASIDYSDQWKMLHYYATRFFNHTLISPKLDGNQLDIYFINDRMPPGGEKKKRDSTLYFVPGASASASVHVLHAEEEGLKEEKMTIDVSLYSWSGKKMKTWPISFSKPAKVASSVYQTAADRLREEGGCSDPSTCFLYFSLRDSQATNWLTFTTIKEARGLGKANFTVKAVSQKSSMEFEVVLQCDAIALFTWVKTPGVAGRFSDNGFLMVDPEVTLTFYAWERTSVEELKSVISVRSLVDIYNNK